MKKTFFMIIFASLIGAIMYASFTGVIDEAVGMCAAMTLASIFSIVVAVVAYKNDVKLVVVLMVLLMILEIGVLSYNAVTYFVNNKDETFYLMVKPGNGGKQMMFSHDGRNYYIYNLSGVTVHAHKKDYPLETALKENILKIEDILTDSIPNDGTDGYEIYYNAKINSTNNDEFSIVVCGNNDIIFGPYSNTYSESLCNSNVSS